MPLPKYNFTPNKDTLIKYALPIIIGVIAISVIIWFIYSYAIKKSNVGFKPNSEHILQNSGGSSNECEILIFSTTWCPHCKKALPEWKKFSTTYNNKEINGYKLRCMDIDCTKETSDITEYINKYKIDSYPTVKLIRDGDTVDFDSKITNTSLEKFVNTMLNQ